MTTAQADTRTPERRAADEAIAAESPLAPPDLPAGVTPRPVETLLGRRRPVAVLGVVEGGVVRPVDPNVRLTERSRVVIVATEPM
ncbi:MAG: hypothetical protein K2V38_24680 [Gemmataceae bacterium]|nr:hypothetical protein [Gemmataceae bacterium]